MMPDHDHDAILSYASGPEAYDVPGPDSGV